MAAYKRNTFILNTSFQIKLNLLLCFIILLSSSFYPVTIYEVLNGLTESYPEKAAALKGSKQQLLLILVLIQTGMLGLFFVIFIFISHKVAGPMFKIKKAMRTLKDSHQFKPIFFRKGDYFQDVADEINDCLTYMINKRNEDFAYLDEVNSYIANLSLALPNDKKAVLKEIQAKLTEIQSRYQ